jgi:hypothetical protein
MVFAIRLAFATRTSRRLPWHTTNRTRRKHECQEVGKRKLWKEYAQKMFHAAKLRKMG